MIAYCRSNSTHNRGLAVELEETLDALLIATERLIFSVEPFAGDGGASIVEPP